MAILLAFALETHCCCCVEPCSLSLEIQAKECVFGAFFLYFLSCLFCSAFFYTIYNTIRTLLLASSLLKCVGRCLYLKVLYARNFYIEPRPPPREGHHGNLYFLCSLWRQYSLAVDQQITQVYMANLLAFTLGTHCCHCVEPCWLSLEIQAKECTFGAFFYCFLSRLTSSAYFYTIDNTIRTAFLSRPLYYSMLIDVCNWRYCILWTFTLSHGLRKENGAMVIFIFNSFFFHAP